MRILGTGLSGLVGSRITQLFSQEGYEFENLSLETGIDITNKSSVDQCFSKSNASCVFHFAAFTDVQAAEKERSLGEKSQTWKVNVQATEFIVENCTKKNIRLIYLDTDYAFDGTKQSYSESDQPNPLSWYAYTKTEGAKRVLSMGDGGIVIRISNPYRSHPVGKKDFVHKMIDILQSGQDLRAPVDQIFVPTYIDDIHRSISAILRTNAAGIFHAVSREPLSPYEAAMAIAKTFAIDTSRIYKTSFSDMFSDRAPVPKRAHLTYDRIAKLGIIPRSFSEGLREIQSQEA